MLLQLVLLGSFLVATTAHLEDVADHHVKPGCQATCGNTRIPYPFGTNDTCYHDKQFLITCNSTYNPPKLFLTESNVEVKNISLDGKLEIMQDIAIECYDSSGVPVKNNQLLSIQLSKFIVSHEDNKFIAVGCDTVAQILSYEGKTNMYASGCKSICASIDRVDNDSCSGGGCCQTSIATGVSHFDVSVDSLHNHTNVWYFSPCSYAFIVEERKFQFSSAMLMDLRNITTLPVVLDWSISNKTCKQVPPEMIACQGNSTCVDAEYGSGYRCRCQKGYRGNPYLPNGCQDIDECEDPKLNNCAQKCVNTEGTYNCPCRKGYYGNGIVGEEGCRSHTLLVIRITVGIAVGLIVLIMCSFWLYLAYIRRKLMKLREKFFRQNGGLMLQQLSERQGSTIQTAKIFTEDQLKKATNHFSESRIIGKGGFGTVYKGILADETVVAIKKSKIVDQNQIEQFINEVLVLSQINHRNVVRLLGCCFETQVPLLVYEFVTNGTLFDYIHNKSKAFGWGIRLRIAAEAAGALSYLHSSASVPIIHRDVKSTNILLDDDLTAKVSDFGTSRLIPLDQTELSTMVQGTLGYLDPEYMQTSRLTEKSDVYSFGVVLVELLTGKKALSFDKPVEERNLAQCFLSALQKDRLLQVLDGCVVNAANVEQLKEVSRLAKRCLEVKGEERPTMKEVAMELEGLRRILVNMDESNSEDTEHLIGEVPLKTFSYGGGGQTSSGYECTIP